ncbi:uncharacterized protein LOC121382076 [Gigantopelta aegis]|uniref:uncharacterized protein LOC121382076 n=1 Tax=Gigantopelta aegis TaxID=1735272 RepID=UPI001B88BD93|nr:uncharacterized protein LOC121382076 [Gigantopelta aegis]
MRWSRVVLAYCCLLLLLAAYCTGLPVAGTFNLPANTKDCADCRKPLGAKILHIQRLQRIKQQILLALGLKQDRNVNTIPSLSSNLRSIDGKHDGGLIDENVTKSKTTNSGGPLFFSVSEKLGEKENAGLVQFVINTGNHHDDLEVLSAHLWLLIKKRGTRKRGRKIVLKVFQVTGDGQTLLTYLRTRVKKTRWQKLSLPISLIQQLLAPPQGKLKLRIACKRCGRRIKVVLPKHKKHVNAIRSPLRQLKSSRHKSKGKKRLPFLVINTRVKKIRHG